MAWVVPVSKNARKVWWLLKRSLHNAWEDKNETDKIIRLPGGGGVTVLSTDEPDNIRSEGYDGMVLDEVAFMAEGVWAKVLRPMLVDRRGWAMFITTPNGHNWFKRDVFDTAPERGWARWQLPTCDNPHIAQSELDEALLDLGPHAYAQEHLAQFTSQEGAEFPAEWFNESVRFDAWPADESVNLRIMALDPSMGQTAKSDYSAWVTVKLGYDGIFWVDCDMKRRDPRQIVRDGLAIALTVGPDAVGIETNGFQHVLAGMVDEESTRAGLPLPVWTMTNTGSEAQGGQKVQRIRKLVPFLSRYQMRFRRTPGCDMLVEQLRAFPVGDHDDGPDALEMAMRLLVQIFGQRQTPREEETWEQVRA
jgi:predicted phage terminase large subunit-like protein